MITEDTPLHTIPLSKRILEIERRKNIHYIYSHLDKNGRCFYIGKGRWNKYDDDKQRCNDADSRNNEWNKIAEYGFSVKILVNGINHYKAHKLERSFIKQTRDITNMACNNDTEI